MPSVYIDDGHPCNLTFGADATVAVKFRTVKPPGLVGGGAINVTTHSNTVWRVNAPKKLKELSPATITCKYQPGVYVDIIAMINVNQLLTMTFPDNTTIAFYGFINSFEPSAMQQGEEPTATMEIIPTLVHTSTGAETAPVITVPA